MTQEKTCMVTGHRELPPEKTEYIIAQLQSEVMQAITDGYTDFISGFARGTDLLFAQIVAQWRGSIPIRLLAALPYQERLKTKDPDFQRLISQCDRVQVYSEHYSPSCFMARNRGMVEQSRRVLAVYDGRTGGGTLSTLRYAQILEKEIRVINV